MKILKKIFDGKKVAIVGNAPVTKQMSKEIDSCDIVCRLNHFYNYGSGNVGTRIDYVFQTFTDAWHKLSDTERKIDVLNANNAMILSVRDHQFITPFVSDKCKNIPIYRLQEMARFFPAYTTGTVVLMMFDKFCKNTEFLIAGFGDDQSFTKYVESDWAIGFNILKDAEISDRNNAIKNLEERRRSYIRIDGESIAVIPLRKNSSLHNKNILTINGKTLIQIAIDKAKTLFEKVYVISDSDEYLTHATENGALGFKISNEIAHDADVTNTFREFVQNTDYYGFLTIIQVTTPEISIDDIKNCYDMRNLHHMIASANELEVKSNVIYSGTPDRPNQIIPVFQTTPRQSVPMLLVENGGVHVFHSEQVFFNSIYELALVKLVLTPNYIDIDSQQDFNNLTQR